MASNRGPGDMIDGVDVKQLRVIHDARGYLQECMRSDDDIHDGFEWGQVYVSHVYKDIVKAWHMHKIQTDFVVCIVGMIKLAIYDGRESSPTNSHLNIYYIGERNPLLIRIPKGVYHGWKGLENFNLVLNMPNKLYIYNAPDEHRLSPFDLCPEVWEEENG